MIGSSQLPCVVASISAYIFLLGCLSLRGYAVYGILDPRRGDAISLLSLFRLDFQIVPIVFIGRDIYLLSI